MAGLLADWEAIKKDFATAVSVELKTGSLSADYISAIKKVLTTDTGLTPGELRHTAGTADGLVAVLDHLLADESALMVFAAGAGIDPAAIGPARELLAGGSGAQAGAQSGYSGGGPGRTAAAPQKPSRRWPGPGA